MVTDKKFTGLLEFITLYKQTPLIREKLYFYYDLPKLYIGFKLSIPYTCSKKYESLVVFLRLSQHVHWIDVIATMGHISKNDPDVGRN